MITPLPKTLTINGFKLTQEYRKGNVAIYAKSKGAHTEYEVVLVTVHPGNPPFERYPSDMAWGTNGWSYPTLDEARKKADVEVYLEETD